MLEEISCGKQEKALTQWMERDEIHQTREHCRQLWTPTHPARGKLAGGGRHTLEVAGGGSHTL